MRFSKYALAATELLLVGPAALFMTALFVRNLQPQQFEPAHTAQRIVMWYSVRPQTGLWIFLIGLPLLVLMTGGATLWQRWRHESELRQATRNGLALLNAHLATLLIAAATLAAGGFLAIVALHVASD